MKLPKTLLGSLSLYLSSEINQCSTHKHIYRYASSIPSSKLFHKDWLSPNEVVQIFSTLEPNSVLPMLHHISKRKDYKPNEALYIVIISNLGQAKYFDSIYFIFKIIRTQKFFLLSDYFFYNFINIYCNLVVTHPLSSRLERPLLSSIGVVGKYSSVSLFFYFFYFFNYVLL